jgi:hypothetical protein
MRTFLLLKLLSKSMLESMDTAFQSVLQGIREPIILAAKVESTKIKAKTHRFTSHGNAKTPAQ